MIERIQVLFWSLCAILILRCICLSLDTYFVYVCQVPLSALSVGKHGDVMVKKNIINRLFTFQYKLDLDIGTAAQVFCTTHILIQVGQSFPSHLWQLICWGILNFLCFEYLVTILTMIMCNELEIEEVILKANVAFSLQTI